MCRKSTTTRCKTRTNEWQRATTTVCRSSERTKSVKFKRRSLCRDVKKPSSQNYRSSRMSRRRNLIALSTSRKTAWKTRLSTSKSVWLPWRLRKIASVVTSRFARWTKAEWTTKITLELRRRKKLCRWKSWRWSLLRSYRTPKLCRRKPTRSWSVPLRNLQRQWPTIPRVLTITQCEKHSQQTIKKNS